MDWLKYYPSNIPHHIDENSIEPLPHMFKKIFNKYANNIAIICMNKSMTFDDINILSDKCAWILSNRCNLKKGDRLAIMLPNIFQFPIFFIATQKLGIICVNINPLYTPREISHILNNSEAQALITLDIFLYKIEKILKDTKLKFILKTKLGDFLPWYKSLFIQFILKISGKLYRSCIKTISLKSAIKKVPKDYKIHEFDVSLNDIALIQYTGGTTALAKGAILTHKNLSANIQQAQLWASLCVNRGQETVLTVLPLYHIYTLTVNCLAFLSLGCALILVPKPIPIENTISILKRYKVTVITGINTLFNALNNNKEFQRLNLKHLKLTFAGGMALQKHVAQRWQELTGCYITQGYGLTEASPITHANIPNSTEISDSIGIPLPSTDAKIVDDDGKELAIGQAGNLIIKGPQVMQGYWNNPIATQQVLKNGWLWTGDIAKRDEKGFFYIVDRKNDLIIVSGFNVYPNEVEELLCMHPKVLEAAVIGILDLKSGQVPKAFIVKKDPSLTEEELRIFCKENLTNYKRPKYYEFVRSLPKSNIGKILRRELKKSSQI